MLRVSGLDSFYYLPMLHDMRYKGPRLSEIIRNTSVSYTHLTLPTTSRV